MKGKALTEGFTRIRAPEVEPRACSILVKPMTGSFTWWKNCCSILIYMVFPWYPVGMGTTGKNSKGLYEKQDRHYTFCKASCIIRCPLNTCCFYVLFSVGGIYGNSGYLSQISGLWYSDFWYSRAILDILLGQILNPAWIQISN